MADPPNAPRGLRLWLALLPAMSVPFLAAAIYFVWFDAQPAARAAYALAKAFTLLWPLFCVAVLFGERLELPQLRERRHLRALGAGIALGAAALLLMAALLQTPLAESLAQAAPRIRAKAIALGVLDHYVAFALFLSAAHSLIEEYYWRWFVYGRLRSALGVGAAVVLASIAFASHHVIVAGQFFPPLLAWTFAAAIAAGGALWCLMYERQRTLAGAWASHMLVDVGIMWVGYRLIFAT